MSTCFGAGTAPKLAPHPSLGAAARNAGLVLGGQAGLSASRFAALLVLAHAMARPFCRMRHLRQ